MSAISFLLSCFLLISDIAYAQEQTVTLWGRIYTPEGRPLPAATVKSSNGKITISDLNGYYRIRVQPSDTFIKVSCIGYGENGKNVGKLLNDTSMRGSVRLDFTLSKSVRTLMEVTVRPGDEPEQIGDESCFIEDYELIEGNLMLLVSKRKELRLQLLDPADSVLIDQRLDRKAESLFKDCMGNVYVYTRDSVFQIFLEFPNIFLFAATPVAYFDLMVKPCTASRDGKYFFEVFGPHNQSVSHFLYSRDQPDRKLVKTIRDREAEIYAKEYFSRISLAYYTPVEALNDAQLDARQILRSNRKVFESYVFYEFVLSKPVYNPLTITGDTAIVFDHFNDSLHFFDLEGNQSGKCFLSYHKKKGWVPELITDEEKKQVFARYSADGITSLHRFDLSSCRTAEKYVIARKTFPEKIRVSGGYVYYLYKDNKEQWANRHLYRQPLK